MSLVTAISDNHNMKTVLIRAIEFNDLTKVAQVHIRAFPESAITALGSEAARRYYEWQLTGPHDCAALGAFIDDTLLGFCFCGVFHGALSGFLRKNRNYLMLRVLTHPWLAVNPLFQDRIVQSARILMRRRKAPASGALPKISPDSFGILSIAVDPQQWGYGVGKQLMQQAEQIGLTRKFSEMTLTVSPQNTRAIAFYEGMGWTKSIQNGRWQGTMSKSLSIPMSSNI